MACPAPPIHLLRFPQWHGSDAHAHLAGGRAAAAIVESVLQPSSVSAVPIFEAENSSDPGCDPQGQSQCVRHLEAITRQAQVARAQLDELPPSARVFTCGGDCGVEVVPVARASRLWPGLAVVWFDAHADLNTPASSPSGHFHGMPVRTLLGDGPPELLQLLPSRLEPSQLIYVGARSLDPPEQDYVDSHAVTLLSAEPASTLPDRLSAALRKGRFGAAYVHVDLDVLDPSSFPHVCCPAEGGLATSTLVDAVAAVGSAVPVVAGAGLTECCGDPEPSRPELEAVARALAELLLPRPDPPPPPPMSLSPPTWPAHYRPIAHEPFGDGGQATLDTLARYVEADQPVVLTGADIVDVERWSDNAKVEALLGDKAVLVKRARGRRFRYWANDDPGARTAPGGGGGGGGAFGFEPPTEEASLSFGEFLAEAERLAAGDSAERLYLQETMSGHPELAEEFRSWNWPFLLQHSNRHRWGPPDSNELFIGMQGAETDAHYDERHNLFFQVRGRKQLLVVPFVEYEKLYPFPVTHPCDRQSMVDVARPNLEAFPAFATASGQYATLQPADLVFLPYGWFHWLRNDDALSISLSFWSLSTKKERVPDVFSAHDLTLVRRNLEKHMAARFGAALFPQRMRRLLRLIDAGPGGETSDGVVGEVLAEARTLLGAVQVADPEKQDEFLRSMLRVRFEGEWQAHV